MFDEDKKSSFKKFLSTDISILNKYFLIAFIAVLLTIVGYTSYALFTYNITSSNNIKIVYAPPLPNLDTSGANSPSLATGMIPVYYDATCNSNAGCWKKADATNTNSTYQWYSYESSGDKKGMWANAVTVTNTNREELVNSPNGTEIPMSDINTMWVWIPRFNAVIPSNNDCEIVLVIDVTFVNTSTPSLDAFWWDEDSDGFEDAGEQKSGFWYGKFETSHNTLASSTTNNNLGCSTETCSNANGIIIKPSVTSLRYNDVSNFFYAGRSMEQANNSFGFVASEVDTHMSKNNEWGAVAYLSESIYGICSDSTTCIEVTKNNCETYTTGIGGDTVSADDSSTTCTRPVNQYNGEEGMLASTTGTVYGIYDINGCSYEYVMGNYDNYSGQSLDYNSGFSGLNGEDDSITDGVPFPDSKYVNIYTGENNDGTDTYYGHALSETVECFGNESSFIDSLYPWLFRSCLLGDNISCNGFYYFDDYGGAYENGATRFALVK